MTVARSQILNSEESCYHCVSRCVRQSFLAGYDSYSGQDYSHRKDWIRDRLVELTQIFTIEVLGYAILDTHSHTLIRTRPDILDELSDEQVVERWLRLFPKKTPTGVSRECYIHTLSLNQTLVWKLRKRLGNISWFMKSLNEFIARKANKEDECKGRFWEGRFKAQLVKGKAALLACSIYIDLNPIRAKIARTPEESTFTSAHERIMDVLSIGKIESSWLAPIQSIENKKGFLDLSLEDYLKVLDTTGREMHTGKRGLINSELAPILERIGLRTEAWMKASKSFGKAFSYVAASPKEMDLAASSWGKRWLKGSTMSSQLFSN